MIRLEKKHSKFTHIILAMYTNFEGVEAMLDAVDFLVTSLQIAAQLPPKTRLLQRPTQSLSCNLTV
jgi:hypothetical protein